MNEEFKDLLEKWEILDLQELELQDRLELCILDFKELKELK